MVKKVRNKSINIMDKKYLFSKIEYAKFFDLNNLNRNEIEYVSVWYLELEPELAGQDEQVRVLYIGLAFVIVEFLGDMVVKISVGFELGDLEAAHVLAEPHVVQEPAEFPVQVLAGGRVNEVLDLVPDRVRRRVGPHRHSDHLDHREPQHRHQREDFEAQFYHSVSLHPQSKFEGATRRVQREYFKTDFYHYIYCITRSAFLLTTGEIKDFELGDTNKI